MTQAAKKPVVHMKCRRGSDRVTEGQTCKGMQAENLSQPGSHAAQFKCSTCGYVWTVPVGGHTAI